MRDTSAFNAPGTLTSPPGYSGMAAPVMGGTSVPDSSPQVTKAVNSSSIRSGGGQPASAEANTVLRTSALMVVAGVVLLWIFGGLVFRNANI